jgi:prolipoprotein diacylglyceryltransferase
MKSLTSLAFTQWLYIQARTGSPWYDLIVDSGIGTYIFPFTLSLGIGLGLLWTILPVTPFPKVVQARFKAGLIALVGAFVCGRIGYILINWNYFRLNAAEIPQVWLGGISWFGALVGGCLAVPVIAKKTQKSAGELADELRPLFASIVVSAWLAGWMTGYAYGVEVNDWWGIRSVDEWGIIAPRWPTQLVGAVSALSFHWIFDQFTALKRIRIDGLAALLELGGFALTLLAISPFRGDPMPVWSGMRLDILASSFYVILCIISVLTLLMKKRAYPKIKGSSDHEN